MMTSSVAGPRARIAMWRDPQAKRGPFPVDSRSPDIVIVGYALMFGDLVDPEVLAELRKVGDAPDGTWAALFVYDRDEDGGRTKWTLWTADRHYAELLATKVGQIELSRKVARDKFPAFQRGWVIDAEDEPEAGGST
jgi:hypothetical protein